jgi:predicted HicB family RNase H-like nuclease
MKKETATVTVRVYPSAHRELKVIAAKRRLSVARLISELLKSTKEKSGV